MLDGKAPVEFTLEFDTEGIVTNPWWTKESHQFTKKMGCKPLKDYETVAACPWCG